MPKVSLSEAARLTGKSRVTIHRHIDKGRLSKELDGTGSPVIDIAELERVYGTLKQVDLSQKVTGQQPETANGNSLLQGEIDLLHERLTGLEGERMRERAQLEESIRDLRGERDRLLKLVEDSTATVRLLTDQRQPEPQPAETQPAAEASPPPLGFFGRARYLFIGKA